MPGETEQTGDTGVAVTIRDVARLAGVSTASVCRALATPERVRPETRQRVAQAAAQLGYQPNPIARGLSTGRTGAIGLIVPDIANPFFPTIVKAAQSRARQMDCALLLADTDEDPVAEVELIRTLAKQVDGFLLCAARAPEVALRSVSDGTPVVTLNRRIGQLPSVVFDSVGGARQALVHLAAQGHRRVAYIAGPRTSWVNRQRLRGLRTAARTAGIELVETGNGAQTIDDGAAAAESVLASSVTAVVAYNDIVALGLLGRLRAAGVDVPGQISLVGFDDIPTTELVDPPLTTVAGPKAMLAYAGIDMLTALLQDRQPRTIRQTLPTELIVRASTAPPQRRQRRPPECVDHPPRYP